MNSSFTWGESRAVDRVWSQVSGLPPKMAASRMFMVMQAFIDESIDKDGTFVMGGYIASAESWARFSAEWEKLLPYGAIKGLGQYHFKMSDMSSPDGMTRVPAFFKIIEDHVLGCLSVKININELKNAINRFYIPNGRPGGVIIEWDAHANPYYIAFRVLMDKFHAVRMDIAEAIPLNEKIDFYFDDRTDKKTILGMWDNYISTRPESIKGFYGATPRFENDADFLPLQAADFWCWWVRKWYAEGTPEKIINLDFGSFKPLRNREYFRIGIEYDEESLVDTLRKIMRHHLPLEYPIYEMKKFSLGRLY